MTQSRRLPHSETARAVQAAQPPVGLGPSTRVFLRGLQELRPPVPVAAAGVLMAVPVVALAGLAVVVPVLGFRQGFWQGVLFVLFGVVLFTLAGLGWRGTKRTVHFGAHGDGFFLARLSLIGLGIVAVAAVALAVQGEPIPWDLALVPAAVAFLWLPWLLLQNAAAAAWPQRVELRRGTRVTDPAEAALLPGLRAHTCGTIGGQIFPPDPYPVTPTHDDVRPGWRVAYTCGGCGEPAEQLAGALLPGEESELGGADLWWIGDSAEMLASTGDPEVDVEQVEKRYTLADPTAWDEAALHRASAGLRWGLRSAERMRHLIPAGADRIPSRLTTGRSTPLYVVSYGHRRDTIERAIARRQEWLATYEAELQRRARG